MSARSFADGRAGRHARWAAAAVVGLFVASSVALLALIPSVHVAHTVVLEASNEWHASTEFRFAVPTEVVVHVASSDPLGVLYGIHGPGLVAGFASGGVTPIGTTTSFWTWGGVYSVEFAQPSETCTIVWCPQVPFTAWANVTAGAL
jgi:hypothetical protein